MNEAISENRKLRVLVTGATGFAGAHVALDFLHRGHDVTAVGRNAENGARLAAAGVRFCQIDLTDSGAALETALAGVDAVVHCAARAAAYGSSSAHWRDNVFVTSRLLRAMARAGAKRLVHISTPSIFAGFEPRYGIGDDDAPSTPVLGAYARSKLAAETLLLRDAPGLGVEVVILRPQGLYGPGEEKFFSIVAAQAARGIYVTGPRGPTLDLTYIDNFLGGVRAATYCPNIAGRAYNLSDGAPLPLVDALEQFAAPFAIRLKANAVPRRVLRLAGLAGDALGGIANALKRDYEPRITSQVAAILSTGRTVALHGAIKDLGYSPDRDVLKNIKTSMSYRVDQPTAHPFDHIVRHRRKLA